jgi:hypothetical protein
MTVIAAAEARWPVPAETAKSDLPVGWESWVREILEATVGNLARDLEDSGALARNVEAALESRVSAVMAEFGLSFDRGMYSRVAAEYVRHHAYDRGVLVEIEQTTKDLLGAALKREIEAGHVYSVAREHISGFFRDLEDWETLRIARTEIATASRYGNLETTRQVVAEHGITVEGVIRIEAADACDDCRARAAETEAQPLTMEQAAAEDFHPNCRGDWVYEIADTEA